MNNKLVLGEAQHKPTFSYAQSRRCLGIVYVGTIVLASFVMLFRQTPVSLFGRTDASVTAWFFNVLACVLLFELCCLPFDLAGFAMERLYKRSDQAIYSYLLCWCQSISRHAFLFVGVLFCVTAASHSAGVLGVVLTSAALSVLLIWKQTEVARLYSKIEFAEASKQTLENGPKKDTSNPSLIVANCKDSGFTGGIVGLPGSESIVIPTTWLTGLSNSALWAELTRRKSVISSGSRTRGVLAAFVFNVLGIFIASSVTSTALLLPLDSTAGLLTMSLCFTCWSFLGLLVLPYPSQLGVIEADRLALSAGVDRELLLQTVTKIDGYLEAEPTRSRPVETIFHPIPTVENRARALNERAHVAGAWHCARYAIYLSILGLGLLGRAVHCNAGRPDLWAMLPAD